MSRTPSSSPPKQPRPARPKRQAAKATPPAAPAAGAPMRIAKAIARAGLCSRRDAEVWIAAGRVAVNGKPISSPALNVGPKDAITVDGTALPDAEPPRLWRFHKPKGVVTTARDPEGRKTVFDVLPAGLPRVICVGRLDLATEGLLLLTNDGALARHLELPSTGWLRRYRVRANGRLSPQAITDLQAGVTIEGIRYGPVSVHVDRDQGANQWLTVSLKEGKNREIKRLFEHFGLKVNRLIRLSFGPFQLGDLGDRHAEEVKTRVLAEQLGLKLARDFGLVTPVKRKPARTSARS